MTQIYLRAFNHALDLPSMNMGWAVEAEKLNCQEASQFQQFFFFQMSRQIFQYYPNCVKTAFFLKNHKNHPTAGALTADLFLRNTDKF